MATDDMAQLADHFREICQEWNLSAGEAQIQAHKKALAPLHAWLLTGVDSPEVVIRAVQVLMADPERPANRKRPAVKQLFKQLSQAWGSVGLNEEDVLILRGMLLATWPRELREGGFALAPLLDSAWVGIPGRVDKQKHLQEWRRQLATAEQPSSPVILSIRKISNESKRAAGLVEVQAPDPEGRLARLQNHVNRYSDHGASHSHEVLKEHQQVFSVFAHQLNITKNILEHFDKDIAALTGQVTEITSALQELSEARSQPGQLDLLWWGQAKYSTTTRLPYRRIADDTERLWWMAWESSELATALEVEPAACFLIETLYQLDKRIDAPKRPLKEWLAELLEALRRIHGKDEQHADAMAMSDHLETLAREDALGLPVTWARRQAANPKPFDGSLEERIRTDIAVDPDTLLDLGDWAAWIFREALLDHRLWEFGD
jgi:hypothetical protein